MSSFWTLFELRMMETAVTTGTARHGKLQSNHHHQLINTQLFAGPMSFLSPNHQRQRLKEILYRSEMDKIIRSFSFCRANSQTKPPRAHVKTVTPSSTLSRHIQTTSLHSAPSADRHKSSQIHLCCTLKDCNLNANRYT